MNCKGYGRKHVWPNFFIWTQEKHNKSGYLVSWLRSEWAPPKPEALPGTQQFEEICSLKIIQQDFILCEHYWMWHCAVCRMLTNVIRRTSCLHLQQRRAPPHSSGTLVTRMRLLGVTSTSHHHENLKSQIYIVMMGEEGGWVPHFSVTW
jgi:hypothetical protein